MLQNAGVPILIHNALNTVNVIVEAQYKLQMEMEKTNLCKMEPQFIHVINMYNKTEQE